MLNFILFVWRYIRHSNVEAMNNISESLNQNNLSLFWIVTILVFLSSIIPTLVNYINYFLSITSTDESKLKNELKILKNDLKDINMMDQFAKHAKLQRKINKIQDQLSDQNMSNNLFKIKFKIMSYFVLYALTGLTMMYISWTYKYIPLLIIDKNLFYPFNTVISFPTGIDGAIGIVPWIAIVSHLSRNFIAFCKSSNEILV